jgi:hypothetical protein
LHKIPLLQPNKQRHGKKKKRVVIPVADPLKAVLDARRPGKAEGTILRNTFGQPWTSDGFRASWGTAFDRAKLGFRCNGQGYPLGLFKADGEGNEAT